LTAPPCLNLGEAEITSGHPRGDINCDGVVDGLDTLYVLAHNAGAPLGTPQGCFAIGSNDLGARHSLDPFLSLCSDNAQRVAYRKYREVAR